MRGAVLLLMGLLLSAAGVAAEEGPAVRIEQVIVGFEGLFRPGHLVPVFVQVNNTLATPFGGELQATQSDDDGDRIRWRVEASVRPRGAQWQMILICPRHEGIETIRVDLVDAAAPDRPVDSCRLGGREALAGPDKAGAAAQRPRQVLRRQPMAVAPGRRIVGVVGQGAGAMGALNAASSSGWAPTAEPAMVVAVPLERFPAVWQGLDMLDVLYWDQSAPAALDLPQQRALAQWVWRGGQLVVGLGSESQGLVGSDGELARLLPVEVLSVAEPAPDLHALGAALLGRDYANQFAEPALVASVRAKPAAQPWAGSPSAGPPLLYRWARGAGSVTAMCTSLAEGPLGRAPGSAQTAALARLLGFQPTQTSGGAAGLASLETSITGGLSSYLDSPGVGGTLIGLAVLLLLAYGLLAGPGTWLYALRRGRRHLSWWLFAAVVAAATLGSLVLSVVRIRAASIRSVAVLDLSANSVDGVLRGYLGLYVPAHRQAEVELVGDPYGRLTPMIEPDVRDLASYPDVRDYDIRQESLTRVAAPVRRTIKQLALDWRGDVGGAVRADSPLAVRFDPASNDWHVAGALRNDLGVDLERAVLIYLPPPGGPGVPRRLWRARESDSQWCRQFQLGRLGRGESLAFDSSAPAGGVPRPAGRLAGLHEQALRGLGLGVLGPAGRDFYLQTLLLSTLALYDQPLPNSPVVTDRRPLRRDALGRLDRSDRILAGQALLVAEARGYLPCTLRVDGKAIAVDGPTVIRVLLDCRVAE